MLSAPDFLRLPEWVPITEIPEWPCPTCHRGMLSGQRSNFSLTQSAESKAAAKDDHNGGWYNDNGQFVGLLTCNRNQCQQRVYIIGVYSVDENCLDTTDEDGCPDSEIVPFLRPQLFQPTVQLMHLHHQVPKDIQKAFAQCFEQLWLDHDACGNKLRVVVELLMDAQAIPLARTLHERIKKFQEEYSHDLGKIILSIKWIGNSGSHGVASLTRADIAAAMEMLDFVTRRLYDTDTAEKAQSLLAYSDRVNAAKGPVERKAMTPPPPPATLP